ncbi:MAG: WYL domain-containing protein [Marinagarivorans sp.]|nr:WYL domain-containing protein [Marinagarivorans sp.]
MSKWPLRWDLLTRYRLIEIVAQWEGRLTTNHLMSSFGIGRQQASKDINSYLQDIAPGNLVYDKYLKGYKPSDTFKPKVTKGEADEYLHLLGRNKDIVHTFAGLNLGFANTEILQVKLRQLDPIILRALVQAAREQKRVELGYISMSSAIEEERIIAPHTLVCTPLRWHVRAYCEKHQAYRDFVLSRFRGTPDFNGNSAHTAEQDEAWNTQVTLEFKPDDRLSPAQQEIIARDYGMVEQRLAITTRAPLINYTLQAFNIDSAKLEVSPTAQQIVIANYETIKPYLF